eukprot:COSAG01_NODE_3657_length_5819_cov_1.996154_4_plen_95_part_00
MGHPRRATVNGQRSPWEQAQAEATERAAGASNTWEYQQLLEAQREAEAAAAGGDGGGGGEGKPDEGGGVPVSGGEDGGGAADGQSQGAAGRGGT